MLTNGLNSNNPQDDTPLKGVRANIVQAIRALSQQELQKAAKHLGHRYLYAGLGNAKCKQDILDMLAAQCALSESSSKSMDALSRGLTEDMPKLPTQPGFILVIEEIPAHAKFDKEAREQLLDIFRDAADFWSDRKIPFRCFYTFAVARKPVSAPVDKKNLIKPTPMDGDERMPTDKLCDISPLALRMSSPFNAGYWSSAA